MGDLNCGLIFKTYEQAEVYIELNSTPESILHNKIKNWLCVNDDGWRADWDDGDQMKWYIFSYVGETERRASLIECDTDTVCGNVYMSEENAEKLVKILNS